MARSSDERFDLVLYLLASARTALDEPLIYASFRLLEAANRAVAMIGHDDSFLDELSAEIEQEKLRMIDDREGYVAWLDSALRKTVAEAKRRNNASDA